MARRKVCSADKEPDSAAERKKLRNRTSQQAFRQRQAAYIKDLERRLERTGVSENEHIAKLEAENQSLRKQLTLFINKLASAQASLQHLSRLMRGTLDDTNQTPPTDEHVRDALSSDSTGPPAANALDADLGEHPLDLWPELETALVPTTSNSDGKSPEWLNMLHLAADVQDAPEAEHPTLNLNSEMPGVWSFNYQMGPSAYAHAMSGGSAMVEDMGISNSMFSDHISAIRACTWHKWQALAPQLSPDIRLHKLEQSTSLMFSLFNGLTRPDVLPWYTPTKWYKHLSELVTWQLHPTRDMYARVHPKYRPSALQVTESYPTFIDWCPFHALRDKLILMHAANTRIDEIVLDIASHYCVEVDLSKLVRTVPRPTPGYVRLWDIIQAMGDDEAAKQSDLDPLHRDDAAALLPAPDAASIFQSVSHARQTFRLLRMDEGPSLYKIDPALFNMYPELYSPDVSDIVASGTLLQCRSVQLLARIPPPARLDKATLRVYRHFADWALTVICA
ncbi:hypothetical protein SLS54_006375 [Diplodia seriata]